MRTVEQNPKFGFKLENDFQKLPKYMPTWHFWLQFDQIAATHHKSVNFKNVLFIEKVAVEGRKVKS